MGSDSAGRFPTSLLWYDFHVLPSSISGEGSIGCEIRPGRRIAVSEDSNATSDACTSVSATAVLAILTSVVLWASAFVAIRAVVHAISPAELAAARFLTASATMFLVTMLRGLPRVARADLPRLAAAGMLGITLYHLAVNTAEVTVTAATAGLLVSTVPIFTALFAAMWLRERLTAMGYVGIVVCMAGAYAVATAAGEVEMSRGVPLLIGAAILQALLFVIQRPLVLRYDALQVTTLVIWFGTLFLLPFAPSALRAVNATNIAPILYLGIFPGAISYLTYAYASSRAPASFVTAFLYLVPMVAVPIEFFWLGEVPTVRLLFGGGIIISGLLLVWWSRVRGISPQRQREP